MTAWTSSWTAHNWTIGVWIKYILFIFFCFVYIVFVLYIFPSNSFIWNWVSANFDDPFYRSIIESNNTISLHGRTECINRGTQHCWPSVIAHSPSGKELWNGLYCLMSTMEKLSLWVISLGPPSLGNWQETVRNGDHFCQPILGNHARITSTTIDRIMQP